MQRKLYKSQCELNNGGEIKNKKYAFKGGKTETPARSFFFFYWVHVNYTAVKYSCIKQAAWQQSGNNGTGYWFWAHVDHQRQRYECREPVGDVAIRRCLPAFIFFLNWAWSKF